MRATSRGVPNLLVIAGVAAIASATATGACSSGKTAQPRNGGSAGAAGSGSSTGGAGGPQTAGAAGSVGSSGTAGATGAAGTTGGEMGVAGSTGGAGTTGAAGSPNGGAGTTGAGGATGAAGTMSADNSGDGDFTIGPAYAPDPLNNAAGAPKGHLIHFQMQSAQSTIYPGIKGPFTRDLWAYVPQQYIPGTPAPFMVIQDGSDGTWFGNNPCSSQNPCNPAPAAGGIFPVSLSPLGLRTCLAWRTCRPSSTT